MVAKPSAVALRYSDIAVGQSASFERTITQRDIHEFARLSGDHNPLHVNPSFGKKSIFGRNIAHGMLAASLFSTLVGMHLPGERCLYLGQTLNFRSPIFAGDTVQVKGTVQSKIDSVRMVTIRTEIFCNGKLLVDGEAKVRVAE